MLFKQKKIIKINVKLLAGLDQMEGYNPDAGIDLEVPDRLKLKQLLKKLNLQKNKSIAFIKNGEKADPGDRLSEGDEVFCFLPFAGG